VRALELPPEIGRAFVRDMRLYFATENKIKRDEIAAPTAPRTRQASTGPSRPFVTRSSADHAFFESRLANQTRVMARGSLHSKRTTR